jgi:hypothetical protein
MRLDVMPTCPDLAVLADRAAGDDDSYQGASGDELAGVLCAWDRLQAHMAARKLAAVAELARRRPVLDPPSSGRPAGTGPDDFAADELAHMLAESRRQAAGLMTVAGRLDARLPGTRAALRDGVPPAPARSAADQPPAATMSIMFRSRQAAGPACVMAARCANDNHTGCPRVYRAEPHTCS